MNSIHPNEMSHVQLNGHPFCTSGSSPKYKKNCFSVLRPFNTAVLAFCLFRPLSVFFLPFLSVVKKNLSNITFFWSFSRNGAQPCVVFDFKHVVVIGTYVYKNQRLCKNGRKIFRPYNFNWFIRHSGDSNFSVYFLFNYF